MAGTPQLAEEEGVRAVLGFSLKRDATPVRPVRSIYSQGVAQTHLRDISRGLVMFDLRGVDPDDEADMEVVLALG